MSPAVWGVLATPATPGSHAGVIVLPGSAGWRPAYADVARALADSGFVALALDYYAATGLDTSQADALDKWPSWQAAVRGAVTYLQASALVSGRPIGLVGYSRGAILAVSVAASVSAVRAVVDFYGGGPRGTDSLTDEVKGFPPLLILHGDADTSVPVSRAYRLRDAVVARGGDVEMHIYPGAQHGFNASFAPAYSEPDARDSWKRTIDFLRRRLRS